MATELFKKTMAKSSVKPTIFIGQLRFSVEVAQLAHWQTTGGWEHNAMELYYEALPKLIDTLTECYFGSIGKREPIKVPSAEYINPKAHITQMRSYVQSNRTCFEESHFQNIIDEIVTLIDQTLYRLSLS